MVEVMGERECNATSEEQAAQLHASAQARRVEAERTAQEKAADAIPNRPPIPNPIDR